MSWSTWSFRHFASRSSWFLLAAAISFGLWVGVVVPAFDLPFVSDDLALLVEDSRNPWYLSLDRQYRLFRDGLNRLMFHSFGMNPRPYHIVAIATFLACVVLLFLFIRNQGISTGCAAAAAALVLLYPRNASFLFAFEFSQETFMTCGAMLALLGWTAFRRTGSKLGYGAAFAGFAIALGYKETGIMVPALLVGLDLYRVKSCKHSLLQREFWRPYAGLLPIILVYGAFVLWRPNGSLLNPSSDSTYKYSSVSGTVLALARDLMNLSFPFSPMRALRDFRTWQYLAAAVEWISILGIAIWTDTLRNWIFATWWGFLVMLPPSMFARPVNSDRYMFLPMLGIAFALGASADVATRRLRLLAPALLIGALLIYAAVSSQRLAEQRGDWARAGDIVRRLVQSLEVISPPQDAASLTLVNIPSQYRTAPILNNGLYGALLEAGYPWSLKLDFSTPGQQDQEQHALFERLLACPVDSSLRSQSKILMWDADAWIDRTGMCGDMAVKHDQQLQPYVWRIVRDETVVSLQ
jgi:hypothetical protein